MAATLRLNGQMLSSIGDGGFRTINGACKRESQKQRNAQIMIYPQQLRMNESFLSNGKAGLLYKYHGRCQLTV